MKQIFSLIIALIICISSFAQAMYASYQAANYLPNFITAGMQVRYEMSNASSYNGTTSVVDLIGNTNATVYGSPVFNNQPIKNLNFSSTSSQYILTNSITSSYNESVFMWIYPTGNGVILTELGQGIINSGWHDSQIEMVNGTLKFGVWPYTTGTALISSSIATPLNNWYYVGLTYNGTTLTAYINGVSAGSVTIARQSPGTLYYGIGASDNVTNLGSGGYGNFKLGAFHYYNRSLSSNEVLLNYNSTKASFTNAVIFSQTYTSGLAPGASIETAFNTFRAALTGTYTTFQIYSNLNPSGITVTDATNVPLIASALRTATAGSWTIGSNSWVVALNCGSPSIGGASVIFTNSSGGCNCSTGTIYTIRPDINNNNWGGIGGECGQPTQTLTLKFY